jgi:spore coat polysaccharide biosynthesis protein SpsF
MKIGFLITARLKSSRLPYKILMDLDGKMVIEHIITRCKHVQNISDIVLCTSTNPQDRPLADVSLAQGIYCFNGSEEDVMQRLYQAAKFYDLDYFVGITADNPLFSVYHANLIVDEIKKNEYDFIKLKGLPLGSATYGMRVKALETVCEFKEIVGTEIWGRLIDRPDLFDIKEIKVAEDYYHPAYRLTLDYMADYHLFNQLYKNIAYGQYLNLYDAIQYLKSNPKVAAINSDCIQLDLDEATIKEIEQTFVDKKDEFISAKNRIYGEK